MELFLCIILSDAFWLSQLFSLFFSIIERKLSVKNCIVCQWRKNVRYSVL